MTSVAPDPLDPFDLPEWLGTEAVTWSATSGLRTGHLVRGDLRGAGHTLGCDLLAVDEAYPQPVCDDDFRVRVHRAWHHHEVELGMSEARVVVSVPGTRFDADLVMEALSRMARSVGATPEEWHVLLRIGVHPGTRLRR